MENKYDKNIENGRNMTIKFGFKDYDNRTYDILFDKSIFTVQRNK